ncbi:hypothetical protein Scep_025639 [Stephania cephalantha]|uniref:protein-serine/threonine phosphatase n=1 Tax=Stephania cephalantha TaxID=152367 RepID=A0AAP0HSL9_9MAGN
MPPDTGRKNGSYALETARNARRKRLELRRVRAKVMTIDSDEDHHQISKGCNKSIDTCLDQHKKNVNNHQDHKNQYYCFQDSSHSSSLENDGGDNPVGISRKASYGSISVCGRRREMEDAVRVELGFVKVKSEKIAQPYDFFAVYDGHGGSTVAEACRDRMHRVIAEEIGGGEDLEEVDWEKLMCLCFSRMDDEINGRVSSGAGGVKSVGSTAVVALVGGDKVVVANCGDSRAVLSRGGVAVPLSQDHKPDRPDEMERIEAAGGRVINWNGFRVLGVLATSRSIGDYYLKPYVIPYPEVTITERSKNDEFLILASDGLWDVISNDVACQVVRRCLDGRLMRRYSTNAYGSGATEAAAVLVELAIARGSKDNISVIVVDLKKSS